SIGFFTAGSWRRRTRVIDEIGEHNLPVRIDKHLDVVFRARWDHLHTQYEKYAEGHCKLIPHHTHNLKWLSQGTQPRYCPQLVKPRSTSPCLAPRPVQSPAGLHHCH